MRNLPWTSSEFEQPADAGVPQFHQVLGNGLRSPYIVNANGPRAQFEIRGVEHDHRDVALDNLQIQVESRGGQGAFRRFNNQPVHVRLQDAPQGVPLPGEVVGCTEQQHRIAGLAQLQLDAADDSRKIESLTYVVSTSIIRVGTEVRETWGQCRIGSRKLHQICANCPCSACYRSW